MEQIIYKTQFNVGKYQPTYRIYNNLLQTITITYISVLINLKL